MRNIAQNSKKTMFFLICVVYIIPSLTSAVTLKNLEACTANNKGFSQTDVTSKSWFLYKSSEPCNTSCTRLDALDFGDSMKVKITRWNPIQLKEYDFVRDGPNSSTYKFNFGQSWSFPAVTNHYFIAYVVENGKEKVDVYINSYSKTHRFLVKPMLAVRELFGGCTKGADLESCSPNDTCDKPIDKH